MWSRDGNREIPKHVIATFSGFTNPEIRAINCSLAEDLYKSLRKSIKERRTVSSPLLNFLNNPNKESNFDKDLETTLIKSELKALILRFAKCPEKKNLFTRPR